MLDRKINYIILAAIFCFVLNFTTYAQGTEFTFQGKLTDQNAAADGTYDMSFTLFDSANVQVGSTVVRDDVQVTNGIFTVSIDFGASAFDGGARQIEISVRPGGSTGAYTVLSPKQPVSSVPYAVLSKKAATADTATNASQLGGVNASQYVKANDARLTDARDPLPNSPSYIQNGVAAQASSNFHISGNGIVDGMIGVGAASPTHKLQVRDPSNAGLRVQTLTSGGTVASFGGLGDFRIDKAAVAGGRFSVKEDGKVGIGTATPRTALEVLGQDIRITSPLSGSYPRFSLDYTRVGNADEHKWQIYNTGFSLTFSALNDAENAETVWMQVNRAGGTSIGRVVFSSSPVALNVMGVSGSNSLCLNSLNEISRCSSSARYKENILDYRPGLDLIRRLRPVSFDWKSDGKPDLGLVAEEVAAIEPLLVTQNDKGEVEGVKYDRVGIVLLNAVKEQQALIEDQQKQIDELRKLVAGRRPTRKSPRR